MYGSHAARTYLGPIQHCFRFKQMDCDSDLMEALEVKPASDWGARQICRWKGGVRSWQSGPIVGFLERKRGEESQLLGSTKQGSIQTASLMWSPMAGHCRLDSKRNPLGVGQLQHYTTVVCPSRTTLRAAHPPILRSTNLNLHLEYQKRK